MLKFVVRTIALSFLLAISSMSNTASANAAKPLVLEEFFRGKTVGKGVFESKFAGVYRPFTVYLNGTWDRKTFTLRLREDFVYEDGERDTKTWFFQKTGDGKYIGQRSDVLGPAILSTGADGAIRFSYVAEVPRNEGSILLRFNDTLTQVDRRTVRNTARVVKGGITLGKVDLTFTK